MKGANESHLYKYTLCVDEIDMGNSGVYTCKVGDAETKSKLTVGMSTYDPTDILAIIGSH